MSAENNVTESFNLSLDHLPTDLEISAAYSAATAESTILSQPLQHYIDVINLYPLGTKIADYDEIAEAAAFGDPAAVVLEWLIIIQESRTMGFDTDAIPFDDSPLGRKRAVEDWEKARNIYRSEEAILHDPLETIEATQDMLNDSIRTAEGALAIAAMDSTLDPRPLG